ncbi:hypothetical protein FRZ61_21300 [Hypericibacter adhaerens]|uniref:FecR protein domain-containing protein n=2 Tax=Hypericibacter adhaerens TaxID=2602016 RepID=A0A5J6N0W6_9PROT|nr:hypothetical protein FRZ61_21300 [Hypericibacter adhaerens]
MGMDRRSLLRTLLAVVGCGAMSRPLASAEPAGQVVRTQGQVTKMAGTGAAVPLGPDAPVAVGDTIVTADGAKVDLRFVDGSLLTVGPSSRVEIARYAPAASGGRGEALLSLLNGIIKLIVDEGGRWNRFAVGTETAIASVRGTEWLVDAAPGKTGVLVLQGAVQVVGRVAGRSVTLGPGQGTDVAAGAAPTPPKIWGAARRDAAVARVTW